MYPLAQRFKRFHSILSLKCIPRQRRGECGVPHEIAATYHEVIRAVQFEKERLARLQYAECARTAWLPKVHFIRREMRKVLEPFLVGDTQPDLHRAVRISVSYGGFRGAFGMARLALKVTLAEGDSHIVGLG